MATYSQLEGMPVPDDRDLGPTLLILTSVLSSLTVTTTILRVWARVKRGRQGWDDYTIAICALLAIGRAITQIVSTKHGNGKHRLALTPAQNEYVNFLTWVTQLFLFVDIGLLKCSICILILRIKNTNILKWCLYIMMVGLVITNGWCLIILLAECSPVKKYWAPATPGHCWNTKIRIYSIYAQVAYSVITDLICAFLPIVVLWNVQIAKSLKFAICGLMSLGLIATACGIVRAASLGINTTDTAFSYCVAAIWANTELHLGIIATNLSLSRSIYGYFAGRIRSFSSSHTINPDSRGYINSFLARTTRRDTLASRLGSTSSQVELDNNTIKKDVEFSIESRSESVDTQMSIEKNIIQKTWNYDPEAGLPKQAQPQSDHNQHDSGTFYFGKTG